MYMHLDQDLEKLKKIRPVEVPDFLFTRIRARVENLAQAAAPLKWKLAFAATALLVLLLNAGLLFKSTAPRQQELEPLVNSLQLSTSNALYYE